MEEMKYNDALTRLEEILDRLRSDTCDVDTLVERTREAASLLALCRSRLTATEAELQEVLKSLTEKSE